VFSGYVAIETQLLSGPAIQGAPEPDSPWDERVPPPGRDATLLAVVPIPGTHTSLAIVGYAVSTCDEPDAAVGGLDLAAEPGSGLLIDYVQRRAWAGGREIELTFQEFELLAFLSAHPVTVFSRAELVDRVWRSADATDRRNVRGDSRTVDVHVSRLRRKLGPVYGQCLVTEHRAGYQFRPLSR
jgi:Transcriptional regulatory protein, C terminal